MEVLVEILYAAYEHSSFGVGESCDEYDNSFRKVLESLNDEQKKLLRDFELSSLDLMILNQKSVLKFILHILLDEGRV